MKKIRWHCISSAKLFLIHNLLLLLLFTILQGYFELAKADYLYLSVFSNHFKHFVWAWCGQWCQWIYLTSLCVWPGECVCSRDEPLRWPDRHGASMSCPEVPLPIDLGERRTWGCRGWREAVHQKLHLEQGQRVGGCYTLYLTSASIIVPRISFKVHYWSCYRCACE